MLKSGISRFCARQAGRRRAVCGGKENGTMNEGNIPGKNEALISLILGIVGLVVALFVNGIFGMILGIAGLVVSSRSKSMGYNDSLRTAGFVLSVLSVVLGGITLVACIACTAGLGILGASLY